MPTAFRADTTHIEMGDGKFDSRRRYIRKVANPVDKTLNMCRGPSISISLQISGVNTKASWRWRVNAATMTGVSGGVPTPPDGFNTGLDIAL